MFAFICVHIQHFYDFTQSFNICLDSLLAKEIKSLINRHNRSPYFVSRCTLVKKKKGSSLKAASKNCRGYEIFTLMQTHNLSCHSVTDVHRILVTLGSKATTWKTVWISCFPLFFLVPQFPWQEMLRGTQVVAACTVGLCHRWGTLCIGNPHLKRG